MYVMRSILAAAAAAAAVVVVLVVGRLSWLYQASMNHGYVSYGYVSLETRACTLSL